MNEIERWIYFDGPEPEPIRRLLDALAELPPSTKEDSERRSRRLVATIEAQERQREQRQEQERERESLVAAERAIAPAPSTYNGRETTRSPEPVTATAANDPRWKNEPVRVMSPPGQTPEGTPAGPKPDLFAGTAQAFEIPDHLRPNALPFRPPRPEEPRAAKTLQVPVKRLAFGETLDLGGKAFEEARAALPFLTSTVGAGVVPYPKLTLIHYASLTAELSVSPAASSDILARYHVLHEAARAALDEHWRRRLADNAEERATFDQKVAEFTAYLRARERQ